MPSPILARADALMQRRRSATLDADDDVPVLTDSLEEDDDFPVLDDIETPLAAGEAIAETPALAETPAEKIAPPRIDAGMREMLAHELARRVEQRLAAELPRLIESTVRDFLAEQEMIAALPADD